MNCLKCGQEISGEQVFCDSCLADMERHPVKPGTPVIIPKRSKPLPSKRPHRKIQKPEDQIAALKKIANFLLALVILLMIACGLLTAAMFHFKNQAEDQTHQKQAAVEIVSREPFFDSI